MSNENVSQHEPAWPRPSVQHALQVFEQRCHDLCRPAKTRAGRPATVRWSHLCLAIMLCVLRGWNAPWEVWRLSGSERLGSVAPVNVSDQAISNRIERAATPRQWLCEQVSAWRRTRLAPFDDRRLATVATAVSAADVSTLDRLSRVLPWVRRRSAGDPRLVAGQISARCDERVHQWGRVDVWPQALDHGTTHVLTLVERVHAGALVLCDRGSVSVAFFDHLTSRGIWWIRRDAQQASSRVSHLCDQADGVLAAIVFLGTSSDTQARFPVRVIHFWLHGRQSRSLTNVLDPHVLPHSEVGSLDARRWDIERAFRAITDHLHLHHLWSAKAAVVQVHLWCSVILAPVSHARQVEGAGHAGVEVCEVSLDLLIRVTPHWRARGRTPLEHAVRCGRDLGLIRPSTRHRSEGPWSDPRWVVPPPAEARRPRQRGRSASQTRGTGPPFVGRVRLNAGTLHVLE